ncbi:hypothetical protein ACFX2G_012977 [Malus domestica]
MKLGFPGPPVLMGKKDFLINLPFVAKVEMNHPSYSFCKVYGFSSWTCEIKTNEILPGVPKLCSWLEFPSGMFPSQRAHSSLKGWRQLMLFVGLLLYWRACRARLKENDRVNFERCLCGALGIGLEAHNKD